MRGNLGERLATEALAALGHQILMYKPDITGTNQPGIDMVTFHNGNVYLIDNKARSRGGNIYGVSALTRNLQKNLATVRSQIGQMAADQNRTAAERQLLQAAAQQLAAGKFIKAVTNANIARVTNVPNNISGALQKKGIQFINVFPGVPTVAAIRKAQNPQRAAASRPLARARPALKRGARPPVRQTRVGTRAREMELEFELDSAAAELESEYESAEGFYTRVQPLRGLPGYDEGHEILTRSAAAGLLSGADLHALLFGVIRPDRGGASYLNFPGAAVGAFSPAAQSAHSLRRDRLTTSSAALAEIRQKLAALYRLAVTATGRAAALAWVGEGLHLIQDSYSGAHVSRRLGGGPGGRSPIASIRALYVQAWPMLRSTAPGEHGTPSDTRDDVWAAPGVLRSEARYAIAASREYIALLLRHIAAPAAPGNTTEFLAFLKRHFSF